MKRCSFILIFIICLTGCIQKSVSSNNSVLTPTPESNKSVLDSTPEIGNFSQNTSPAMMDNRQMPKYPMNAATPDVPPSLYDEAQAEAQKWFDARVHRCGEFYRAAVQQGAPNNVWVAVIKNEPTFTVEGEELPPRTLSEAERLNGVDPQPVEWEGKINVSFGPYRINPTFMWQDNYKVENVLYKRKGKWFTQEDNKIFQRVVLLKFTCDQIPASLRTQ
jgi:hypothetical protein